jgi:hypothetical protein
MEILEAHWLQPMLRRVEILGHATATVEALAERNRV